MNNYFSLNNNNNNNVNLPQQPTASGNTPFERQVTVGQGAPSEILNNIINFSTELFTEVFSHINDRETVCSLKCTSKKMYALCIEGQLTSKSPVSLSIDECPDLPILSQKYSCFKMSSPEALSAFISNHKCFEHAISIDLSEVSIDQDSIHLFNQLGFLENFNQLTELFFGTILTPYTFPKLPNSLTHLSINSICCEVNFESPFSDNLTRLIVYSGARKIKSFQYPKRLTHLTLDLLPSTEKCFEFPQTLTHLRLDSLPTDPSFFSALPNGLLYLSIGAIYSEVTAENLPNSILSLNINNIKRPTTFKNLPTALRSLEINSIEDKVQLPDYIPQHLEHLVLSDFNNYISIPYLPSSLISVSFGSVHGVEKLPILPRRLQSFKVNSIQAPCAAPDLPDSLREFSIQYIYPRTIMPKFPSGLQRLHIGNVWTPTDLTHNFPPSLTHFTSGKIHKKLTLPESFPSTLRYIALEDVTAALVLPKELPRSLQFLKYKEKGVTTIIQSNFPPNLVISPQSSFFSFSLPTSLFK